MPRALALGLCLSLVHVAPARADGDAELRVIAGPAYLAGLQSADSGQDASTEGLALAVDFALGLQVADDLSLGADLVLARSGAAEHGVLDETVFTGLHLGAGATYWLVPSELFLAGSLGLARSSVEGERVRIGIELPDNAPSDLGLGAHLCLGKQFPVSGRFGLGLALSLLASFANNPLGGEDDLRTVLAASLGVSLTLN